MIVLNFAHPLTAESLASIAKLMPDEDISVRDVPTQFDLTRPFVPQIVALADACRLAPAEWQTLPILVNLPSLNTIAATLLAELHGRMGYFPPIIVLRPATGLRHGYEASELVNLNELRGEARLRRM